MVTIAAKSVENGPFCEKLHRESQKKVTFSLSVLKKFLILHRIMRKFEVVRMKTAGVIHTLYYIENKHV